MTNVKICGITNLEDALLAARLGADALGFNFYRKSPRYIDPEAAKSIIAELPGDITKVGVFVNSDQLEIQTTAQSCGLDVIQLHGDESQNFVDDVRSQIQAKVMKVFRIGNGFDANAVAGFSSDTFLLDADSSAFGGAGNAFDWGIAREIKKSIPNFYLAGGLTPENVVSAIHQVQPFGVDVCSGVEHAKGKKDSEKLAAFMRNVREA